MQKKLIGLLLAILLLLTTVVPALAEGEDAVGEQGNPPAEEQQEEPSVEITEADPSSLSTVLKHYQYLEELAAAEIDPEKLGADRIVIQGEDFIKEHSTTGETDDAGAPVDFELVEGSDLDGGKALSTGETALTYWNFEIKSAGMYHITLNYTTASLLERSAERNLYLDGVIPYSEFAGITLDRVWKNTYSEKDNGYGTNRFETDDIGDELAAKTAIVDEVISKTISGNSGLPSGVYLEAGTHTLALQAAKEKLVIDSIEIAGKTASASYADYYKAKGGDGKRIKGQSVKVEAETPAKKSTFSISASSDRTDSAMSPSSAAGTTLNIIGSTGWKTVGDWVEWNVEVPEEGFYKIAVKARQSSLEDMYVSRKVYINGEVPFYEANFCKFFYEGKWVNQYLGDGQDTNYYFYFNKGVNTIRMEVTMGDMSDIYDRLNVTMLELNSIYRSILSITGSSPDKYRDYDFDKTIPEVLEQMAAVKTEMGDIIKELTKLCGSDKAQIISLMRQIMDQIDIMVKKPDKIPVQFARFKSNMGSYGSAIINLAGQALSVDYLTVASEDVKLAKARSNIFSNIGFNIKLFINSFLIDYSTPFRNAKGSNSEPLQVWIHSGRDQAQILRQLLRDTYDDNVNVKLVVASALLPSVLTGVGPHVSIGSTNDDPVNYAVRGAVEDLTQFSDFKDVIQRFEPSAITPFTYRGKVYALPENQTFSMLFYRTDIFEQYGLTVPKTWDEFIYIIPILQRNNMDIGLSPTITNYLTLMYQNGETLYKDVNGIENAEVNFDCDGSISAFQTFCDFFTQYGLPVDFDFANRFRTGELPLAIVDYTSYNQLTAFAPEIKGLWAMAPCPGIQNEDGTVTNTVVAGSTSVIMLTGFDKETKERAWNFMKWWTSAETQSSYCSEMENLLGPAGKQATANKEALGTLGWTAAEYAALSAQRTNTQGTPCVPGNYMVSRYWKFAYDTVYNDRSSASEELEDTIIDINAELKKKREEFETINKK